MPSLPVGENQPGLPVGENQPGLPVGENQPGLPVGENQPRDKPPGSKLIRAAGAVAWQRGPDGSGPEVLLVHRKKYDDWSLPKGKRGPGEPLPVTAVREVLEESGTRLTLGRRLIPACYQVGGRPKRVCYWAARATSTDGAAVPNAEVDKVAWLPAMSAKDRVSYPCDAGVLDDFARLPADTVPLILLRHARALPKSGWQRDDAARPLDDAGRADAMTLAGLLTCFAPAARVVSSPALRCLESVRPYAGLSGGTVQVAPALHIQSFRTDGSAWPAALISDAVAAGKPVIFCAHRENLPVLHTAAAAALRAGAPAGVALPAGWDQPLPTGSFRVLHIADGALVAADRYDLSDT